ncbi:hypothetical protein HY003_01150 [Candidatus Saccharibacteria bacterium]|nr:hypothetical protein [Candidatus Saccharibacteria bacterium]MBI3337884.1 hypothetical protein [Candidatus Saccharibacteria bacterium]
MIFESKTDFSERDISLDTLNEERRFWAKEGDSKSREFVLRGLYIRESGGMVYTGLTQNPSFPGRISSSENSFIRRRGTREVHRERKSCLQPRLVGLGMRELCVRPHILSPVYQ